MSKKIWWIGAIPVLLVLVWLQFRGPRVASRVYRTGWRESPPFEVRGADGQPAGLAVDLVRTAAQRRGINLQWVYWEGNVEHALRDKRFDLWPLMTITPERLRQTYISEPYLEAEFCLLVRADSTFAKVQDLATSTVSFSGRTVDTWHLDRALPRVRRLSRSDRSEVMADLCERRADAAFMNAFMGIATLLDRPGVCGEQKLRWIATPGIRSRLGIGAPFEFRAAADALRDEIGLIVAEGKLDPILGQSGSMSQQLESMEAVLNARKRGRRLAAAALLFALLATVACWQSVRFRRETKRARLAEETLRKTEQELRLMANNMKEVVLAYDMDRRLIYANPAVKTLTGYTIADLERDRFVSWVHPDDQARMRGYWDQLFRGEGFENVEYRLITRDGRTKWVSVTWGPIFDEDARQIGVQGSKRDVTERKLADEALRESEQRFRGLLEHVQLAAAIFDIQGKFLFVNDCMLELTGWTRDEMMGRQAVEFVPPDQGVRIRDLLKSLAQTGEPAHWFSETPILTKDGKRRWLQVNNVALRDAGGKVAGVASLGADVTEHRALQEQYFQSQKLESLGTLAGGVAHDFNNLLTVINGYSEMVLRSLQDDAVRSKIQQIQKAGARAAVLTQQLLAFSRRQVTEPRPLDLNELVEESSAMFRTLLGEDIELQTKLSRDLGLVMADQGLMHQVLMNLLANARDAMPGGGRVIIETMNVMVSAEQQAEYPEATPGPNAMLAITDTGSGMNEETRARVFEPFFTTKGPGQGTGLGLATVYGIVKQSEGWIGVDSDVGKGTTFKIYLPRTDAAPVPALEKPSALAERAHDETILVVEDEEQVRGLATAMLESLGYRVLSAADGPAALALARSHKGPIHLALVDVVLRGMNGKQLAEHLALLRPKLPVLFTSGHSHEVITHRNVVDRDVAYIAKPYSPDALARKVREVMDKAAAARA